MRKKERKKKALKQKRREERDGDEENLQFKMGKEKRCLTTDCEHRGIVDEGREKRKWSVEEGKV